MWFTAGRGQAGRRRVEDPQPPHRRQHRAPTGACRLCVLRIAPIGAAIKGGADVSVTGRLVVRRVPDLNTGTKNGQETLFDTWRFHAFFTTTDHDVADTVAADNTQRGHAIIEQVHADLKHAAFAHLPSGKFTANAAGLVLAVMAHLLSTIPYVEVPPPTLALPERPEPKGYERPPREQTAHVPDHCATLDRR